PSIAPARFLIGDDPMRDDKHPLAGLHERPRVPRVGEDAEVIPSGRRGHPRRAHVDLVADPPQLCGHSGNPRLDAAVSAARSAWFALAGHQYANMANTSYSPAMFRHTFARLRPSICPILPVPKSTSTSGPVNRRGGVSVISAGTIFANLSRCDPTCSAVHTDRVTRDSGPILRPVAPYLPAHSAVRRLTVPAGSLRSAKQARTSSHVTTSATSFSSPSDHPMCAVHGLCRSVRGSLDLYASPIFVGTSRSSLRRCNSDRFPPTARRTGTSRSA